MIWSEESLRQIWAQRLYRDPFCNSRRGTCEITRVLNNLRSRNVLTNGKLSSNMWQYESQNMPLTSGMSSSTLQASWYGGNGSDQPPALQLRLTIPRVIKGQRSMTIMQGNLWKLFKNHAYTSTRNFVGISWGFHWVYFYLFLWRTRRCNA